MISCKKSLSCWVVVLLAIGLAGGLAPKGIFQEVTFRAVCAFGGLFASIRLWKARSGLEPNESTAFAILSAGLVAWSLGIAVHLVDLLQGRFSRNYPPADVFFLVAAALSVAGMARLPTARTFSRSKRVLILDQAIAAISSGVVFWHLAVLPNLHGWGHHSVARLALTLLYPMVEFVILQMAVDLLVRGPSRQELTSTYRWAAIGFFSLLSGNILTEFGFWGAVGWDRQLLHWTNLGFALPMVLASSTIRAEPPSNVAPLSRWLALRESLVPLAWVALPSFTFAWIALVGGVGSSWDLLGSLAILVVLVVIRQRLAASRLISNLRSAFLTSLLPAVLGFQLLAMVFVCLILSFPFQRLTAGMAVMLLFLASGAVTTWTIFVKARNLSRPIERLTRAASEVQTGNLSARAGVAGIDEVGRLGLAMDSMVERLEEMVLEQRDLAQKANEASLAKSRFLANMSHEIRTPLNGVLGLTELLASGNLPPSESEMVHDLRESARNLRDLVGDILDLAKIEAERISIERVPFSPATLVEQIDALFTPSASSKGLVLNTRWDASTATESIGDPSRIRQVLSNLVSNAIKFSSTGEVAMRGTIVSASPPRLRFEIEDSGIGIPIESHDRIWHEFVQADDSTTRKFGGTGLGLSISRNLARLMGGDLTLERSTPGVGSLFALEIPFCAPSLETAPQSEPKPEIVRDFQGLRVLVAEDNSVNQKVIAGFLRRLGCHPQLARDGIEAVEAIQNTSPDLVLMDVHMPRMDGLAATRALRESGYTGKIWALTASALAEEFEHCIHSGMDGFLAKPIGLAELRQMLDREFGEAD